MRCVLFLRLVDFWSETLKEWTKASQEAAVFLTSFDLAQGAGGGWDSDDEVHVCSALATANWLRPESPGHKATSRAGEEISLVS